MEGRFTILIADRNRHVREFLKREMLADGYRVELASNGREVLEWIYRRHPLDLLILDLDLPGVGETSLFERLQNRVPTLPVVVHTFLSEYISHPAVLSSAALVEKKGNNIDRLKQVVYDVLRKFYGIGAPSRDVDSSATAE